MVRAVLATIILGTFCLILAEPQRASAQKGGNSGTVKKVDPKTGAITFTMQVPIKGTKKKTELGEKEYLLEDDAKVTIVDGKEKTMMTGKEAVAAGAIKEGSMATFVSDGAIKIKELTVGGAARK